MLRSSMRLSVRNGWSPPSSFPAADAFHLANSFFLVLPGIRSKNSPAKKKPETKRKHENSHIHIHISTYLLRRSEHVMKRVKKKKKKTVNVKCCERLAGVCHDIIPNYRFHV